MISLATVAKVNTDQFWQVIQTLDPELYLIKVALDTTNINPRIIPRFIRSLANLATGSGYGKVQVFMEKHNVTAIKGEESDKLNLPVEDTVV